MDDLATAAGAYAAIVPGLVHLVFPIAEAAQSGTAMDADDRVSLTKDRRVADAQRLAIYFEKTLPTGVVPASVFADFLNSLSDPDRSRRHLDQLPDPLLPDLFERLPDAISAVRRDAIANLCVTVLVNGQRLGASVGGTSSVDRLVATLLGKLDRSSDRCAVIGEVMDEFPELGSQYQVVRIATTTRAGDQLVDDECARELAQRLLEEVLRADEALLRGLPTLGIVLEWIARTDKATIAPLMTLLRTDGVYIQYLATLGPTGGFTFWVLRIGTGGKIPLLVGDFPTFSARLATLRAQLEAGEDSRARLALQNGDRILAMF